jgi:hypothetical protein
MNNCVSLSNTNKQTPWPLVRERTISLSNTWGKTWKLLTLQVLIISCRTIAYASSVHNNLHSFFGSTFYIISNNFSRSPNTHISIWNFVAFSPQAKYTDWRPPLVEEILCQLLCRVVRIRILHFSKLWIYLRLQKDTSIYPLALFIECHWTSPYVYNMIFVYLLAVSP